MNSWKWIHPNANMRLFGLLQLSWLRTSTRSRAYWLVVESETVRTRFIGWLHFSLLLSTLHDAYFVVLSLLILGTTFKPSSHQFSPHSIPLLHWQSLIELLSCYLDMTINFGRLVLIKSIFGYIWINHKN